MKVTKAKAAEHRARIVLAASRLFRKVGLAGVGVAELTAEAGLTHGGFYRHFESKEALFGEACLEAFREAEAEVVAGLASPEGWEGLRRRYLSDHQVSGPTVCPIATLGAEVARLGPEIQAAFAQGLRSYLGAGGREVGTPDWNRSTATLATMIGLLIMARAVRLADRPLADALLDAASPRGEV